MHRIILEIGPLTLYSYGLVVAVGFVVSTFLILKDSDEFGLSRESVFDCMLAILIAGIIGGRLFFVFINWEHYSGSISKIFKLQEGGMAFQGAFVLALIAGAVVGRVKKLPFWRTADLIAPYIALGQAIGRIGCFLNGCCYGKVATSGLCVTFPGETVMRIPTQIYSSLCLVLVYAALLLYRERRPANGSVFAMYLISYGIFRFFIDYLRGDNPAVYFGLTLAQILSIAMFLCGLVVLIFLKHKVKEV